MFGGSATGRRGSPASRPEPRTRQGLLFPFVEGAGLRSARLEHTAAPPPWTSIHPFNRVIHSAACAGRLPCARRGRGGRQRCAGQPSSVGSQPERGHGNSTHEAVGAGVGAGGQSGHLGLPGAGGEPSPQTAEGIEVCSLGEVGRLGRGTGSESWWRWVCSGRGSRAGRRWPSGLPETRTSPLRVVGALQGTYAEERHEQMYQAESFIANGRNGLWPT